MRFGAGSLIGRYRVDDQLGQPSPRLVDQLDVLDALQRFEGAVRYFQCYVDIAYFQGLHHGICVVKGLEDDLVNFGRLTVKIAVGIQDQYALIFIEGIDLERAGADRLVVGKVLQLLGCLEASKSFG